MTVQTISLRTSLCFQRIVVFPLYPLYGEQNPWIWRATCTTSFYIRDLYIRGFRYLQGILEPIPHWHRGMSVQPLYAQGHTSHKGEHCLIHPPSLVYYIRLASFQLQYPLLQKLKPRSESMSFSSSVHKTLSILLEKMQNQTRVGSDQVPLEKRRFAGTLSWRRSHINSTMLICISISDVLEAREESNIIPLQEHFTTPAAETYGRAHTGKQGRSFYWCQW